MSILSMRKNFAQYLKPILIVIAGFFVISCFMGYGGYLDPRKKQGAEESRLVATVNGEGISRQTYQDNVDRLMERMKDSGMLSITQALRQRGLLLEQMIGEKLRLQAAARERVKVSRRDIRNRIDGLAEEQVKAARQAVSGKKTMPDWEVDRLLSRMSPPTSLRGIRKEIRKGANRDSVRATLLIEGLDKLLDARFKDVSDKDWMDSYKKVRARHILVRTGVLPEEQAKRRADEILKKLQAGGDFATLARQFSDDPGSKGKGGELGFFGAGMMTPEFEKAAFALRPGDLSGLVKTPFGYHIIQVEEAKTELPKDWNKNRNKLREEYLQQQVYRKKSEYYGRLFQQAKIDIQDQELLGYMSLQAAMRAQSPQERDKKMVEAMRAYERAIKDDPNNHYAWISLAEIHLAKNEKPEAVKIYENLLDGKQPIEDAELRVRLGQMYKDAKQNDKAIAQFEIASDVGYANPQIHQQLKKDYEQLKRPDLAAKEQKYIDDYMKQMQEAQGGPGRARQPLPTGAPVGPRPGG